MTTIICSLKDCIHNGNTHFYPENESLGRCKCTAIGINRMLMPKGKFEQDNALCDSYHPREKTMVEK